MYSPVSILFLFGASILLLLLTANASPLPTTTLSVFHRSRITPIPRPMHGPFMADSPQIPPPQTSLLPNANASPLPTITVSVWDELRKALLNISEISPSPQTSLLPNATASPLPDPTVSIVDEFRKLRLDISAISSFFNLTKREEHPAKLLCGGEHCKMVHGQCKCPQRDTAWPEPLITTTITEIEGEPTPTPTPTEISSTEDHSTLEERAVDGTEPHHTLSPRDNEEERRKPTGEGLCQHKEQDCTRWHGILLPTEGAAISKRDIGHPTLSHKDNETEPTITQSPTTTHLPTPTTFPGPCDPGDEKCLIEYLIELYDSCDASDTNCFLNSISTEVGSPTPPAAVIKCAKNDRRCPHFLRGPPLVDPSPPASLQPTERPYPTPEDPVTVDSQDEDLQDEDSLDEDPWAKAKKEEKRDVDVVLPTASGTSELKPDVDCSGMPWLCL